MHHRGSREKAAEAKALLQISICVFDCPCSVCWLQQYGGRGCRWKRYTVKVLAQAGPFRLTLFGELVFTLPPDATR